MARQRKGSQVDIPSQTYGQGAQVEAIQKAGGGIAGGGPTQPAGGDSTSRRAAAASAPIGPQSSVFGPTQRPNEPITAGVGIGAGSGPMVEPNDPMLLLQAMYSVLPHPAIARLMLSSQG